MREKRVTGVQTCARPIVGSTLGAADVNIGTFHLGRRNQGGEAVLLLSVDGTVTEPLRWEICNLTGVKQVKVLRFA